MVDAKLDPYFAVTEAGDYYGPIMGFTGDKPAVFFRAPVNDGLRHVESPPHVFTEQPDGTLTITESIGCLRRPGQPGEGYTWHGYLTKGEWVVAP